MTHDRAAAIDDMAAGMASREAAGDAARATGRFAAVCRDADGTELWREEFGNLLTTAGKNFLLDQALAGAAYTAVEYMGLISSVSYSAVAAADTMLSHAGWLECGGANAPAMSSTRQACAWSAAAAGTKALSAVLSFTFTAAGSVAGSFIVAGAGASAAIGNTGGTLYAGGAFGTAQPVIAGNTVTMSYSSTLT